LNIEAKVIVKEFNDKLEEKEFVIEVNLKRRHLDIIQKCELAEKIEAIEREKAKMRQLSNLKQFKDTDTCDSHGTEGEAAEIAAKKVGLSTQTYKRYKVIKKHYPDIIPKIKDKKVSINHAYGEAKRIMNMNNNLKPKLHTDGNNKKYNVILADPPYDYDIKLRGNPSIHYKTLTDDQIYNFLKDNSLEDKIDDNAILFLWTTNPKLKEALKTIEAWKFEYKTNIVWIKDKIGLGYYVRSKHELLLIAVKGNMQIPLEANRPESVIYHNRSIHSKKPEIVYDIIESMYPNANYLELFARNTRENWDSYGLEI
jgi:N6-adenosine-specific RNA methylase IME4